jgi:signal transduction histidine kinase
MLDAYRAAEAFLPLERRRAIEDVRRKIQLDATLDDLVGISTVVRRGIDRSVRIVQNLKNFSRAAGESIPTDLHAGLEETLLLLGPRLRKACIQVVRAYGDVPAVVAMPGEINQIFMNLLTNAIQALETRPGASANEDVRGRFASDPGPVAPTPSSSGLEPPPSRPSRTPRAAVAEIRIETWVEDAVACVAISDNGPGVPAHIEKHIFDPFFTTKPRGEGTGLGLSISSEIARRHGGTLTLGRPRGEGDRGATFLCRLPLSA